MKKSSRARRMDRHHRRNKGGNTLNLTALMDIFTILLIFLLVNNDNAAKLPDDPDIDLPQSTAQELPKDALTIQVSGRQLLLDDRFVVSTEQIREQQENTIAVLVDALNQRASRAINFDPDEEREIMILADRKVPYTVIRKIMRSCMETPYTKVAFAVLTIAEEEQNDAEQQ